MRGNKDPILTCLSDTCAERRRAGGSPKDSPKTECIARSFEIPWNCLLPAANTRGSAPVLKMRQFSRS